MYMVNDLRNVCSVQSDDFICGGGILIHARPVILAVVNTKIKLQSSGLWHHVVW